MAYRRKKWTNISMMCSNLITLVSSTWIVTTFQDQHWAFTKYYFCVLLNENIISLVILWVQLTMENIQSGSDIWLFSELHQTHWVECCVDLILTSNLWQQWKKMANYEKYMFLLRYCDVIDALLSHMIPLFALTIWLMSRE